MAEGMIKLFAQKLGVMIVEEYKYLRGVEGQVMSLRDELEWISSFLRDAAVHRNKYERVDVWVSQIRDLAYDAEDILEMFIHKVKRLREKNIRGLINYPSRLITLHKLGNQIDSINNRIERISKYKSKYAIDKLEDENSLGRDVALNKRIKAPDVEEDDVIGFKTQSDKVIRLLFEKKEESSKLHVVSIVGMPGTGKSTLAHKVFNDVKKENKFDSHAWIDVSQEFESQKLLKIIKESKGKEKENLGNKDQNRGKEENPMEKGMGKLLVVFDDVRRTEDWDELLSDVLRKIKSEEITVLLTSCSTEVATHANSCIDPYKMDKLNEEEGIELLQKKVFHEGDYPKNLKNLAKKIVKKCDGLPLAIVVLGGLLSMKPKTVDVWSKVLDSANWQLLQGPTKRLEVVALSYDDLPNFLKPCFLYLGLFPVDKSIDCETLIQLWIAEGFIQERGEEAMEDVAEDYLEELAQRNMIRVKKRHYDGSPSTCRIQGLFRELAISKGRQDKFIDIMGSKRKATRHTMSRRIGFHAAEEEESEGVKIPVGSSFNNPRSVLCFSKLNNVRLLEDKSFNKSFKFLRVLDLQGATNLGSLPDEIGNLVLLKYLNLRGLKSINRLPSSIRNLRRLQTLYIDGTGIVCIPWSICKLEELRHFYSCSPEEYFFGGSSNSSDSSAGLSCNNLLHGNVGSCGRLPQIQRLRNLRTLCTRAENWKWDDFSQLTNLRILRLWGLKMDLHGEALSTWIAKFIYLRELSIEGEGKLQFPDSFSQHVHLYSMSVTGEMGKIPNTFPPNLTAFELSKMALNQEEGDDLMNTLAALKNLKKLVLNICFPGKSHIVIPAGGFPSLTSLVFSSPDLEELKVEEGSLLNLKYLYLCLRGEGEGEGEGKLQIPDSFSQHVHLYSMSVIGEMGKLPNTFPPNLTDLELSKMALNQEEGDPMKALAALKNLKELVLRDSCFSGKSQIVFPAGGFPNLIELSLLSFPDLEELKVEEGSLPNLQSLYLYSLSSLRELQDGLRQLTSLQSLGLSSLSSLRELPDGLRQLTSLQSLYLSSLSSLRELPDGLLPDGLRQLTSLQSLSLSSFSSLTELPDGLRQLTSLQSLYLGSLSSLRELPDGLRQLTSLQSLYLDSLSSLRELPDGLRQLTSLQSLHLHSLSSLRELPDGLRQLTNLQDICLWSMPQKIKDSVKRKVGDDWEKIKHIPIVRLF